jgi:hypothetical protein
MGRKGIQSTDICSDVEVYTRKISASRCRAHVGDFARWT